MGSAVARRRSEDTVEIVYEGHLTSDDFSRLAGQLRAFAEQSPFRFAVLDIQSLTGMDTSVRASGAELIALLRQQALEQLICIGGSPLLRMAASTIALVGGVPLTFVAHPADAEREILTRRERGPATRSRITASP